MFNGLALFMTGLVIFLSTADEGEKPTAKLSPFLYKVLDVFENNRMLISVGRKEGAQKGDFVDIFEEKPKSLYVGCVELVEVGTLHSIGRFIGRPSRKAQLNDHAYGVFTHNAAKDDKLNVDLKWMLHMLNVDFKMDKMDLKGMLQMGRKRQQAYEAMEQMIGPNGQCDVIYGKDLERIIRANKQMTQWIEGIERKIGTYERGGAIIDLSHPK